MTERLSKIFSVLPSCKVFADIGCDHGYIAKAMLDSGKCERAIISDISEKCLKKAQTLLAKDIENGIVDSVVSNGFEKVDFCDLALIAGMGGEEIISIIENAKNLPNKLVLQPMKNAERVRVAVVEKGYKILDDFVFYCGEKYYHLIALEKGNDHLTDDEIYFGRTNLKEKSDDFLRYIGERINLYRERINCGSLGEKALNEMVKVVEKLEKICIK